MYSLASSLYLNGHLTLSPLVAAYENHSRKRPVPVTNTFSAFRGCPLTRTSTLLTDIIFLSWNDQFSAANWCQHWFEFFPNPPVNILGMVENLLVHHDKRIMQHFVSCNVTSQVSPLLKSQLTVESIKSPCRVVTKISGCQVNTTSRRGINWTARDFFWFYFSSIFLWKQSGATFIVAGEISGPRLLMTALQLVTHTVGQVIQAAFLLLYISRSSLLFSVLPSAPFGAGNFVATPLIGCFIMLLAVIGWKISYHLLGH